MSHESICSVCSSIESSIASASGRGEEMPGSINFTCEGAARHAPAEKANETASPARAHATTDDPHETVCMICS